MIEKIQRIIVFLTIVYILTMLTVVLTVDKIDKEELILSILPLVVYWTSAFVYARIYPDSTIIPNTFRREMSYEEMSLKYTLYSNIPDIIINPNITGKIKLDDGSLLKVYIRIYKSELDGSYPVIITILDENNNVVGIQMLDLDKDEQTINNIYAKLEDIWTVNGENENKE